jgi:hypothetical protein
LQFSGAAYQPQDISIKFVNVISTRCSGLMVLGINRGCRNAALLRASRPLLTYQLRGEWGRATATGFRDGKTVAKATWQHLKGIQRAIFSFSSRVEAILFLTAT